jgi:hypothetical protein
VSLLRPPATAIIIPVPEAADLVDGEPGMPPHITVLWPFTRRPRTRHRRGLDAIAAAHEQFGFTLARVGRFPSVVYLAPEPAAPFVALIDAVTRTWPRHQPYGGAYPDVIPHLTVPDAEPSGLETALPISCTARELVLMVPDRGGWREDYRVPLAARSTSA